MNTKVILTSVLIISASVNSVFAQTITPTNADWSGSGSSYTIDNVDGGGTISIATVVDGPNDDQTGVLAPNTNSAFQTGSGGTGLRRSISSGNGLANDHIHDVTLSFAEKQRAVYFDLIDLFDTGNTPQPWYTYSVSVNGTKVWEMQTDGIDGPSYTENLSYKDGSGTVKGSYTVGNDIETGLGFVNNVDGISTIVIRIACSFTTTGANQGNPDNLGIDNIRFASTFLPVEISYFGVKFSPQGVQVKWTTQSEIENLGFIIERKTETTEWTEIASYKTDDALLGQGSVEYATDYEYVDSFVKAGQTYEYRLGDVDYAGTVTYHATRSVTVTTAPLDAKVEHFTVLAAYPNPFNPSTTLRYAIPAVESNYTTTVQIYDLTGKLVKTLLSEQQSAGWHSVVWHGTDQFGSRVPAGVYLSKVSFGGETKTIKVMLLK